MRQTLSFKSNVYIALICILMIAGCFQLSSCSFLADIDTSGGYAMRGNPYRKVVAQPRDCNTEYKKNR